MLHVHAITLAALAKPPPLLLLPPLPLRLAPASAALLLCQEKGLPPHTVPEGT